jgi:hypothetical protein
MWIRNIILSSAKLNSVSTNHTSLYYSLLHNTLFSSTWPLTFSSGKLGAGLIYSDETSTPSSNLVRTHHVTGHNTPIHNILSTALQLSISQKALGTLPEDGNIIQKHVGDTSHN